MEWNDSRGVLLSWDGTTPGESFLPGMERNQGNLGVLGWNDSSGVILSCVGTTPGGHSIRGPKDSSVVIMSWERTTPGESFCPEKERL